MNTRAIRQTATDLAACAGCNPIRQQTAANIAILAFKNGLSWANAVVHGVNCARSVSHYPKPHHPRNSQ